MKILVLGSGGREHALCWKISASPLVTKLWCMPGNAGIASDAECVPIDISDHPAVIAFCKANQVDFVVVGPDAAVAAGVVDDLDAAGFKAFGPTKSAGRLESSKSFTKQLCRDHNIPTAAYAHFADAEAAKAYIREKGAPIVVKADGLAAGKGVVVAMTLDEALSAVDMMFGGAFGDSGAEVVIEEFMTGEEASFFALCDGEHALPLATAQDHKRAYDGDTGPNTGGMGAYSPASIMTDALCRRVMDEMIYPTLRAMKAMGAPYKGVLYAGIMLTEQGPKLVEYNARFGDPECQVLMLRMMSDVVPALLACADGQLKNLSLRWYDDAAITVIMATNGYPGDYGKGSRIDGLEEAKKVEGVEIFHAGTKLQDGHITAYGGRVLNVSALGKTVSEARDRAYAAIDKINWPEGFYRRDIAGREVRRERGE
ncbi:phosphoribosylamine--glycine ligase [Bradyrhizobium sp. LHD-71]|uniref:phosphoribosylamine--glycine ligase n=1 Tax=Bradyrhizobium sp. LHD-71 TaxID=3072141 RepID=UPI00280ED0AC|nr:phosphoribosylamine--glycine ligase [Bradyrhizobium sp. LHD-71]MDQ8726811.1 phosphoribosylamine--glycine ligase [Bradyrhizobium sp. LHD-71]